MSTVKVVCASAGNAAAWIKKQRFIFLTIVVIGIAIFGAINSQWLITQAKYQGALADLKMDRTVYAAAKADITVPNTISIPAIGLRDTPIIGDEPSVEADKVALALQKGVLHYGNSAEPGKNGRTVIVGHSSGPVFGPGDYKWVFILLNKLKPGDQITINNQGISYVYTVTGSLVVSTDNMEVLKLSNEPLLTLVTCSPVGTSKDRLIVNASLDSSAPKKLL